MIPGLGHAVEGEADVIAKGGGARARVVSVLSRGLLFSLLVLGAGLRIGLFLGNRSLWFDEGRVALNILYKGPRELLNPAFFYGLRAR
jgi:hypothetical protein